MTLISRAFAAVAFLTFAASAATAQEVYGPQAGRTVPLVDPQPLPASIQQGEENWFYEGSDLEQETAWVFGELPNGLRYALRNHRVPPGQVSFRAVVDAGSLYEEDSEQGYAHLLEHLLFRESKYLGPDEAFPTWQRMGAQIGIDTNATTSPTQTVYQIDLPSAAIGDVGETLRLLSGMLEAPVLSDANVTSEIPVVLAEKRDGDSAQRRVADRQREVVYAGQRIATRAPIGTVERLQAATGAAVEAFHKRWYRPENTVLVVVGDIDTTSVARLIEQHYAEWRGEGAPVEAPAFGDPVVPADAVPSAGILPPLGETELLVEPDLSTALSWAILRPWRPVLDTKEYNRGIMRTLVAQSVLNRRLEGRARAGDYLYAGVRQDKVYRSADATFIGVDPLEGDWDGALATVRGIIEDAIANPPTQEEIDREVANFEVGYGNYFEKRGLRPTSELADDIVGALDIRETTTSPGAVLELFQSAKPGFTPEAIHAATRALFEGTVSRAVLVADQPGLADEAALAQALSREVAADGGARLEAAEVDFAGLPPVGTPREATVTPTGIFEIERLDWDNGVSALIWPTFDEPGRVLVKVRFGAGMRAFSAADAPYVALGELALIASGQAGLDNEALDRLANGRKIEFGFSVEDGTFALDAETRKSDVADQLYLFAAKLAQPRWDEGPVKRARAAAIQGYRSYGTSPAGVIERDLEYILRGADPRFRSPTAEEFAATDDARFAALWEKLLRSGPVEVQVFGDLDRAETIAALNRTFGALPPRGELPADTGPRTVKLAQPSTTPITLTHRGSDEQAAAVVAWNTGGGVADYRTARRLEVVTMLFTNRLLEAVRQRLGAAYSPQMVSQWPIDLDNGGRLLALVQVKPEDVPVVFAEAEKIARDLIDNGPGEEELIRTVEPLRQLVRRASTGSAFFMWQLEGATQDPRRFAQIDTLYEDFTVFTVQDFQQLAQRYLKPEDAIRIAVLPEE